MTKLFLRIIASMMLFAMALPATAQTYTFDVSGLVADGNISTSPATPGDPISRTFFDTALTGFSPFTISVGDTIQFNIMLDEFLDVPAGNSGGFFGISFPGVPFGMGYSSSSTFTFLDGALAGTAVSSSCSNCVDASGFLPGPFGSFSFSQASQFLTITSLPEPSDVSEIGFRFQIDNVVTAVPETSTWVMLILGFGMIGYAMRRRQLVKTSIRFA